LKRILFLLLTFGLPLIINGQEHTYTICPGETVLFDLQSLNPNHREIVDVVFDQEDDLLLYFPNQLVELLGDNIPPDYTVAYAQPQTSGVYTFGYTYNNEIGEPIDFSSSVEVIIDADCSQPLPCYEATDSELFMPAMLTYGKVAMDT